MNRSRIRPITVALSLLVTAALSAGIVRGQYVPLEESEKTGILKILAVTSFGEATTGSPSFTLTPVTNGQLGAKQPGYDLIRLKYGVYRLEARYSASHTVRKTITIKSPHQVISICFFISPMEASRNAALLRGRLPKSKLDEGCRWVRLMSPFTDEASADTVASDTGYFAFENVRSGLYSVIALNDKGICSTSEARILIGANIVDVEIP